MKNKLLSIIICIALLFSLALNISAEGMSTEVLIDSIIRHKLSESGTETVQEWLDLSLTEHPADSVWYVIALPKDDELDFSVYRASLEKYLSENTVASAATRQKIALSFSATGGKSEYIYQTLSDSVGKQGLMSYVYGLHILNNGFESESCSASGVIDSILSLQLSDGGWAIMGDFGDTDATAMVIQSLAPHYSENENVRVSVDKALSFLSSSQLENADYASMGESNCESISQVIIALCSLGIDPEADGRFIKEGTLFESLKRYSLPSGGYCHTVGGDASESATAQAMLALSAYSKMLEGEGSIYLFEGISYIAPENDEPSQHEDKLGYKPVAICVIVGITAAVLVALALTKKLNKKNLLAVLTLALASALVVNFVDISSVDSYYGEAARKEGIIGSVTLTIRCDTVAGLDEHIPSDGIILDITSFEIDSSDTVYDILVEAAKKGSLHMESSGIDGLKYVSGIENIYEFDFGDLSGWTYRVNGEIKSVGCDEYILCDGDSIEWLYTVKLGNDLE